VNKKMIILSVALASALVLLGVYLLFSFNRIDTDFATEATLRFSVRDDVTGIFTNHEFSITAEADIIALQEIFRGRTRRDIPACGFVNSVSITMYGEGRSITFCPALDGCPIIRINDSERFINISYSQRAILDDIFARFGFTFPAI